MQRKTIGKRRYEMWLDGLTFKEIAIKENVVEQTAEQSIRKYHGQNIRFILNKFEAELGRKPYRLELMEYLKTNLSDRQKSITCIKEIADDRYRRYTFEGQKMHQQEHEQRVYKMMAEIVGLKVLNAIMKDINSRLDLIDPNSKIPDSFIL